ncbi:hypothetical protein CONLIGDRAFT_658239 [Coniochaeta ligniaria NRRL 30616]|uniref:Uncharacterized protein n=1 Tax=Coniochaeta ligniaria NRRL 30616 TaxID=1408157 RepID=A0A1J7IY48_9PEZI|nr:hypothetical protein CONLIGDRAFT_658239 [Coniochaeta ligniaria NRRL 30616]
MGSISGDATPLQLRTQDAADMLPLIRDDFAPELERLKRAYSLRNGESCPPASPSPSQILFGQEYDEINRTLVGVLALKWLYTKQYETFVGSQAKSVRLSHSSFEWIHGFFTKAITGPEDLYMLITSMVVNDLGKDSRLALDYQDRTGDDISSLNHDMILIKAVKAGLVPCLNRLRKEVSEDIIRGMELGSEFNFGQLAQAENAPACLSSLLAMRGQEKAFNFRFMEQLLDIAGAAGHVDWTCAKKLVQPIFDAYEAVYHAAMGIISGGLSLRGGYDLVLHRRAVFLRNRGMRQLDVESPDDRALARILCMGGVADLDTAELYEGVWSIMLSDSTRKALISSLNIDGSVDEPAIQPTYMPALMTQAVKIFEGNIEAQERALASALRYLERLMTATDRPEGTVSVIERNVLDILKEVVQSTEFKADPTVLERADIPRGVAAKRD